MFVRSVALMNDLELVLNHIEGLKAQMAEWATIMESDPYFSPPLWVVESLWNRLDFIQRELHA